MVINYLALMGLLISFCGAFVTGIPVIWYRKVTSTTTSGLTAYGDHVFVKIVKSEDLNAAFEEIKRFAIAGLVVLGLGVAYGCLGLVYLLH